MEQISSQHHTTEAAELSHSACHSHCQPQSAEAQWNGRTVTLEVVPLEEQERLFAAIASMSTIEAPVATDAAQVAAVQEDIVAEVAPLLMITEEPNVTESEPIAARLAVAVEEPLAGTEQNDIAVEVTPSGALTLEEALLFSESQAKGAIRFHVTALIDRVRNDEQVVRALGRWTGLNSADHQFLNSVKAYFDQPNDLISFEGTFKAFWHPTVRGKHGSSERFTETILRGYDQASKAVPAEVTQLIEGLRLLVATARFE